MDLRGPDDAGRREAFRAVTEAIHAAAAKRQAKADVTVIHESASVPCSPVMIEAIERAIVRAGIRPARLPSGAGHDAAAMAELVDVGVIFLRCEGGVSHTPEERASPADVAAGIEIILHVLDELEG